MKLNLNSLKKNKGIAFLFLGLLLGWLFFHKGEKVEDLSSEETHNRAGHELIPSEEDPTVWTCSMHPQIRQSEPGNCPICGMELIPVDAQADADAQTLKMSESAVAMANIQTTEVTKGKAMKKILLNGKIMVDERLYANEIAHFPGRIEKLYLNFTGEPVQMGQKIAQLYSPELIVAQEELIEALKYQDKYPSLVEAARNKLRNWKISEAQIAAIEKAGEVQSRMDIHAHTNGIVTEKKVKLGDHVAGGTIMYDVADLRKVWVMFDAYESDLAFFEIGDNVNFTIASLPGQAFEAPITYIDPVVDPNTRTVSIRTELDNKNLLLKPDMFARAEVMADLGNEAENRVVVPKSAVLWTGTRSVVYVQLSDQAEPTFVLRQVTLGPSLGEAYIVKDGLAYGELVVTNGAFNVDAAAQLKGLPSMMKQEGSEDSNSGGGMQMNMPMSKAEEVHPEFQLQLDHVLQAYYELSDDFFTHQMDEIQEEAETVNEVLAKVNMNLVQQANMKDWMEQFAQMERALKNLQTSTDLEEQKQAFDHLSQALRSSIGEFGVKETVYYQVCPMGLNNSREAFWLSSAKEIHNPYMGAAMSACGEIKEVI